MGPRRRYFWQFTLGTMLLLLTGACIVTTLGVWRVAANRWDWWILPYGPLNMLVRGIVHDAFLLAFAVAAYKHRERECHELRLVVVAIPGVLLWLTLFYFDLRADAEVAFLWYLDDSLIWPIIGLHILCLAAIMLTLCWRTEDYVLRNLSVIVNASFMAPVMALIALFCLPPVVGLMAFAAGAVWFLVRVQTNCGVTGIVAAIAGESRAREWE